MDAGDNRISEHPQSLPKRCVLESLVLLCLLAFTSLFSISMEFNDLRFKSYLMQTFASDKHQTNFHNPAIREHYISSENIGGVTSERNNSKFPINPAFISPEIINDILSGEISEHAESLPSPACYPHFNLALPDGKWSNGTKFKRIYFYHARKAGGSSMSHYFYKVARHYGLKYQAHEWIPMEEPATWEEDTFYITHIREPVDRSISHFKYQGRWACRDLINREYFTPTEENAKKLETWTKTSGHVPIECNERTNIDTGDPYYQFALNECAVNCYIQWFSGLSCPMWNITWDQQYKVAKRRVLRYNLIIVIEKLKDPSYVQAIEQMFGMVGLTEISIPFCQRPSRKANKEYPLLIENKTLRRLKRRNSLDIELYHELSGCIDNITSFGFPQWDPARFELDYYNWTHADTLSKSSKSKKGNN